MCYMCFIMLQSAGPLVGPPGCWDALMALLLCSVVSCPKNRPFYPPRKVQSQLWWPLKNQ